MLNLLMFFLGITMIFLIARYNRNNKLFWMLLLAMLSGFVGGTVANSMLEDDKQVNVTISTDEGTSVNTFDLFKTDIPTHLFDEPEKEIEKPYANTEYVNLYVSPSKSGTFKPRQYHDFVDTS